MRQPFFRKKHHNLQDNLWIWLLTIIGVGFVVFVGLLAFRSIEYNQTSAKAASTITTQKFHPPTLKSLIVNPNSQTNYFDFLLDTGDVSFSDEIQLEPKARDLINYFFLGITLPPDEFWVNLNPIQPDKIVSPRLGITDMGRVLLDADLQLKKDSARFTDPRTSVGKEYWQKLNKRLQEKDLSTAQVPTSTRVWIVPGPTKIREQENKTTILSARLRVCLESEYLSRNNQDVIPRLDRGIQKIEDISSQAFKEVILPKLEQEVNFGKNYAELRQVYNSLILSECYKRKYWNKNNFYSQSIHQARLVGLCSKEDWEKDKFFQAYLASHKQGEYSFCQTEYDPNYLDLVSKRYFSGGIKIYLSQSEMIEVETVSSAVEQASPLESKEFVRIMTYQKDDWAVRIEVAFPASSLAESHIMLVMKSESVNLEGGIENFPARAIVEKERGQISNRNKHGGIDFLLASSPIRKFTAPGIRNIGDRYALEISVTEGESYDDIVIKELAKQKGVSVDDLEADFERTVTMLEERIRYSGFVEPSADIIAQKIHEIFDRLIAIYKTKTDDSPACLYIVDANTVNAFVIRKRTDVHFYKGLYETLYDISQRMRVPLTEDMIAFIIAHELSHSLQHTSHEGLDVRDINEQTSPYLIQMIKNGEYDADMRALELMDKAGYSIFGAVDAMIFLEFITGSSQAENVLSSHPYVSLRKHRLSQIIFDQKTNVFTNVKAPRTPMVSAGRMNSQDVDFRYLMDKSEQDFLTMAQDAESLTALDELAGMFMIRKRMNALKNLVDENQLKISFLRHVYMQAVLTAIISPTGINVMPNTVDYSDMKGAAAIYDFGKEVRGENILQKSADKFEEKIKDIIQEINESLSYGTSDDVIAASKQLQGLLSTVKQRAKGFRHNDFDGFLLPFEDVKYLMPIFTKGKGVELRGISIGRQEKASVGQSLIDNAIRNPRRLISAFFYATYLGQDPSVEFGIPTTDMRVKLQRRKNTLYLENPAYRSIQSVEDRRNLQNIVLLHYAMNRTQTSVFSDNLNYDFPGIDRLLKVAPETVRQLFMKYYNLLSIKYPKPVGIVLAVKRIRDYLNIDVERSRIVSWIMNGSDTPEGFINRLSAIRSDAKFEYTGEPDGLAAYTNQRAAQFIDDYPLIVFIREAVQKYGDRLPQKGIREFDEEMHRLRSNGSSYSTSRKIADILTAIAHIYSQEPRKEARVSEVFSGETKLDYYLKEDRTISSLKSLLALPDWAVSDYLNRKNYDTWKLIREALEKGTSIDDIFTFMKMRLAYEDRRKIFNDIFFGYYGKSAYLLDFFKTALSNDPKEIIVWFLGMFSKKDALELIDKLSRTILCEKTKDTESASEAKLRNLTIALLEYIYSQTSKNFHADKETVKVYLDLINSRIEESGKADDEAYVREAVQSALMILSAAVDLTIEVTNPEEVSQDGMPDFKSEKTSIVPTQFERGYFGTEYVDYNSSFTLHNFGWNDKKSTNQSIFVTHLTALSLVQLKELLKQRLRYVESQADIEYRGEVFSLSGIDDFFANLITFIMLKKSHNPDWANTKEGVARLDDLLKISVLYSKEKRKISVVSPSIMLKKNENEINSTSYDVIRDNFVGVAIPSGELDPVWEDYVKSNNLQGNFPEIIPLLQNPNVGNESIYNPIAFLEGHKYGSKVPYRQIVKKFFMDSSVYARLFNAYVKLHGRGYVYGKYKSLEDRLEWIEKLLPHKSIIKDGILNLWETDIFPEIIADLPALVKLAREASSEEEDLGDMWTLLGEMDDDVGRLKRLNDEINLSPERIHKLIDFYMTIIPLALSPQKIARYGATSYMLWIQLPENVNLALSERLNALTKFMPEPSALRDELLMKSASRYVRCIEDAPRVSEKLYSNNLLSRNRDLRTEDFVSETLLHLFGGAKTEDRRDVLLWIVGAQDKPRFVADIEDKYDIDFTTLPIDVKLLPATIREKFIEGFMLGDNGVMDPQHDTDREVMSDFLEQLFIYIFPEGTKGIGEEERVLISKVFLTVMESFPPYRRVQIIKALAALRVRSDFEKTSAGERLSVLLGAMGPVGIKVAQYLSENETLVPDDSMRSSLGALRHKAPEITKISAVSVLENEIPLAEVLVQEIGEPVGVASIKQVNRGRWLDIEMLSELVMRKAPSSDADEVREKMRSLKAREITFSNVVSYLTGKAQQYKINIEDATVSVVFKIRRPNIETTLGVDYAALDAVAQELEGTYHKGEALNISDLVQTVKEWVTLENNFNNEVKLHDMLTELDYTWAADFEKQAAVTIDHPRILYATDALIVEEEMQGVPLLSLAQRQQPISIEDVTDAGYMRFDAVEVFSRLANVKPRQARITLSLKKAGFSEKSLNGLTRNMLAYDYAKLRELLRHILLHQIFIDGVFHADLHQGNVLITPEGKLVMIDRGNVGTLNKEQIEGAKILLKGLSLRKKELIKQGIDLMFVYAQYPEGIQPMISSITVDDIQEILDKGYDLKMNMNIISVRAVQGAKNTPGGRDFSTFLKAFTQAMYLFPTDPSNGIATLQAIAQYISMNEEEARQATQEQAKYFVVKDVDTEAGEAEVREGDIVQITKRLFYEKTDRYFMRSVWRPIIFRIMAIPVRMAASRVSSMKSNIMTLVRTYGPQVIKEHIDEFVERQDSEIADALRDMLSVQYTEQLLITYVKRGMKERFWSRLCAPVAMPLFKGTLFLARPFTRIYVEAAKEWIDVTGRRYIASIASQMTVREGIELVSQVFVEDFSDIKKRFDEEREKNQEAGSGAQSPNVSGEKDSPPEPASSSPAHKVEENINSLNNIIKLHQEKLIKKIEKNPAFSFEEIVAKFKDPKAKFGDLYRLKQAPITDELKNIAAFRGEITINHVRGTDFWIARLHYIGRERAFGKPEAYNSYLFMKECDEFGMFDIDLHNHPLGLEPFPADQDRWLAARSIGRHFLIRTDGLEEYSADDFTDREGNLIWPSQLNALFRERAMEIAAEELEIKEPYPSLEMERILITSIKENIQRKTSEEFNLKTEFIPWKDATDKMILPDSRNLWIGNLKSPIPQRRLKVLNRLDDSTVIDRKLYLSLLDSLLKEFPESTFQKVTLQNLKSIIDFQYEEAEIHKMAEEILRKYKNNASSPSLNIPKATDMGGIDLRRMDMEMEIED
jgi:predicted unusual protein kinase regulating ubiquinone biosynthesis (AarF/ABC1/UbiB family)